MLRRVIAALVFALLFAATALPAIADDTYVNGYFKSNGTYVEPHFRSAPNGNPYDNYSTKGNINPYTGKSGPSSRTPTTEAGAASAAATTRSGPTGAPTPTGEHRAGAVSRA